MALSPGTQLGPYEIVAPAGAGGMGEVYRAHDSRLNRDVAIKVLPAHLSGNPELRERFEREARAISQLSHPHICVLYDIGKHDGADYLNPPRHPAITAAANAGSWLFPWKSPTRPR